MKKLVIALLILMAKLYGDAHPAYPPNPLDGSTKASPAFTQANAQAIYWINLIDQQQYWAAWLEGSSLFRDVISREQWAAAMRVSRTPLGPVTARKVINYGQTQVLPHGTHGNFMLIQFETQYAKRASMRESITLMTEGPLALWKVVNYNITR